MERAFHTLLSVLTFQPALNRTSQQLVPLGVLKLRSDALDTIGNRRPNILYG